ncbi:MAG TPA: hypothetical protein VEJ87_03485 [Acidimicrobiales bacterium]|nr:hypothetical protein [Acidimicrobiales bacterium]
MTQPSYVPVIEADQVRPSYRLSTPRPWHQSRPAELKAPTDGRRRDFGMPGPDQGYALLLAEELYSHRVELDEGESLEDAIVGCSAVAGARAALFGRAPVAKDVELALTLFGFLGGAPHDLREWRREIFRSVAHHYLDRLELVGRVPETTLRMTLEGVRTSLPKWRELIDTSSSGSSSDSSSGSSG